MSAADAVESVWGSVGHDEPRAKRDQRLTAASVRIIDAAKGSRRSRRRIQDDPQMGAGVAKSHELSADARIAAARNPEAYNPGGARDLSHLFLKVSASPAYPGPRLRSRGTHWPVDGCTN